MFVGMSRADEGIVKVYNLGSGASHQLTGHKARAPLPTPREWEPITCCCCCCKLWAPLFVLCSVSSSYVLHHHHTACNANVLGDDTTQGQVYALAVANNALFSAGQDCSIRVWQYNEAAGIFMSQAILNATNGDGHRAGVHSLAVLGQYMFSGDRSGTLKACRRMCCEAVMLDAWVGEGVGGRDYCYWLW